MEPLSFKRQVLHSAWEGCRVVLTMPVQLGTHHQAPCRLRVGEDTAKEDKMLTLQ